VRVQPAGEHELTMRGLLAMLRISSGRRGRSTRRRVWSAR
jgi:hypothetical protein